MGGGQCQGGKLTALNAIFQITEPETALKNWRMAWKTAEAEQRKQEAFICSTRARSRTESQTSSVGNIH